MLAAQKSVGLPLPHQAAFERRTVRGWGVVSKAFIIHRHPAIARQKQRGTGDRRGAKPRFGLGRPLGIQIKLLAHASCPAKLGPTQSLVLRSLCHGKGFLPQSPRHGSYVCGLRLAATQLRVSPVLFYQFRVQEVCPDNIEHLEWLLYWQVIRVTRIQPWRG
jgi:hypothetical protein